MAYFKMILTQVCAVLKSLLSKAIARYRARVMAEMPFTREAIKAKVQQLKMAFEATHGTKTHQDVLN